MKGYMFFNVIASLKTLITTALQLGVMYLEVFCCIASKDLLGTKNSKR